MTPEELQELDKRLAKLEILAAKLISIARKHPMGRALLRMIATEEI